jgi:hypothetical protein
MLEARRIAEANFMSCWAFVAWCATAAAAASPPAATAAAAAAAAAHVLQVGLLRFSMQRHRKSARLGLRESTSRSAAVQCKWCTWGSHWHLQLGPVQQLSDCVNLSNCVKNSMLHQSTREAIKQQAHSYGIVAHLAAAAAKCLAFSHQSHCAAKVTHSIKMGWQGTAF